MHTRRHICFCVIRNDLIIEEKEDALNEPQSPRGTIAILIVYVVLVVALWGSAYLTMLGRGVTQ